MDIDHYFALLWHRSHYYKTRCTHTLSSVQVIRSSGKRDLGGLGGGQCSMSLCTAHIRRTVEHILSRLVAESGGRPLMQAICFDSSTQISTYYFVKCKYGERHAQYTNKSLSRETSSLLDVFLHVFYDLEYIGVIYSISVNLGIHAD